MARKKDQEIKEILKRIAEEMSDEREKLKMTADSVVDACGSSPTPEQRAEIITARVCELFLEPEAIQCIGQYLEGRPEKSVLTPTETIELLRPLFEKNELPYNWILQIAEETENTG